MEFFSQLPGDSGNLRANPVFCAEDLVFQIFPFVPHQEGVKPSLSDQFRHLCPLPTTENLCPLAPQGGRTPEASIAALRQGVGDTGAGRKRCCHLSVISRAPSAPTPTQILFMRRLEGLCVCVCVCMKVCEHGMLQGWGCGKGKKANSSRVCFRFCFVMMPG